MGSGLTNPGTKIATLFLVLSLSGNILAQNADQQQMLDQLESIRAENDVAAFGLVLVEGNEVSLLTTSGLADTAIARPIKDTAIFRTGSITKMFTGLLAARLAAGGEFALDDAIKQWPLAGTYRNPWQDSHPITVAQLLEHSAGLSDLSKAEWDYSDPRQLPLATTLRMHPDARQTHWPPGLHYSYSNAGAGLAGRVMELATGDSYGTLVTREIFDPMAMHDSSVLPPDPNRLPVGYDSDGITPIPYWHQIFRPFAAVNASLHDMGRFIRMLLNDGSLDGRAIFKPEVIARLETPTTTLGARAGLEQGYGLGNYNWFRRGVEFRGHGGDADGYLSRLGYTRENQSGYFLVITAFQGRTLRAMEKVVEEYLIRDLNVPAGPAPGNVKPRIPSAWLGTYEQVTYRFAAPARPQQLTLFTRDGALLYRRGDSEAKRLVQTSDNTFRHFRAAHADVFIGAEGGDIYFQHDGKNFRRIGD